VIADDIRQDGLVQQISRQRRQVGREHLGEGADHLAFVVAHPGRKARVIAQPFDLVDRLLTHLFDECGIVIGIGRTGEHEVLPDQYAVFVA